MARPMARWVLPVPGGPRTTTFSRAVTKSRVPRWAMVSRPDRAKRSWSWFWWPSRHPVVVGQAERGVVVGQAPHLDLRRRGRPGDVQVLATQRFRGLDMYRVGDG